MGGGRLVAVVFCSFINSKVDSFNSKNKKSNQLFNVYIFYIIPCSVILSFIHDVTVAINALLSPDSKKYFNYLA